MIKIIERSNTKLCAWNPSSQPCVPRIRLKNEEFWKVWPTNTAHHYLGELSTPLDLPGPPWKLEDVGACVAQMCWCLIGPTTFCLDSHVLVRTCYPNWLLVFCNWLLASGRGWVGGRWCVGLPFDPVASVRRWGRVGSYSYPVPSLIYVQSIIIECIPGWLV